MFIKKQTNNGLLRDDGSPMKHDRKTGLSIGMLDCVWPRLLVIDTLCGWSFKNVCVWGGVMEEWVQGITKNKKITVKTCSRVLRGTFKTLKLILELTHF